MSQKFNADTFEYLRKIVDTRIDKRQFNVISDLQEYIKENYRLYLRFKKRPKKGVILEEYKKSLKLSTDEDYEISNPTFNSLGTLVTNPPYEVFEKKNRYICLIEIPDLNEIDLSLEIERKKTDMSILIVKGVKNSSEMADENDNEHIT